MVTAWQLLDARSDHAGRCGVGTGGLRFWETGVD
jgi:hypothetical protein